MIGAPEFDYNRIKRQPLLKKGVTCDILGVKLAVSNMRSVITQLSDHLEEYRGRYVCVTNVHTDVMAHDNPKYGRVQNRAVLAVPDGKPLEYMLRKKGHPEAERIAGPELLPALCALSEEKGYRHFFYGASEETLQKLKTNLMRAFPQLQIAGTYAPPFKALSETSAEEMAAEAARINETRPDYVWVGLGAPKQEFWMARQEGRVNAVMLGVGAAFEFHAGTVKRAPKWVQDLYLEWLYRLLQDPKRLLKRYVTTNVKFLWWNLFPRKGV